MLLTPTSLLLAFILLLTPFKPEKALDPKNINLLLMPPQLPMLITCLLDMPNINILIKSLMDSAKHLPLTSPLPKQPPNPKPLLRLPKP
jgi:hypothetical protein